MVPENDLFEDTVSESVSIGVHPWLKLFELNCSCLTAGSSASIGKRSGQMTPLEFLL
jgi:hypothetical protein